MNKQSIAASRKKTLHSFLLGTTNINRNKWNCYMFAVVQKINERFFRWNHNKIVQMQFRFGGPKVTWIIQHCDTIENVQWILSTDHHHRDRRNNLLNEHLVLVWVRCCRREIHYSALYSTRIWAVSDGDSSLIVKLTFLKKATRVNKYKWAKWLQLASKRWCVH